MKQILNQELTPIDILNIFVERHRLFSPFDAEADIHEELNSDSTIKDWRDANDLLPWHKLYPVLNEMYNIIATREEWEKVLVPAKSKKLIDACEFISNKANLSNIESVKLLGNECLEARIFSRFKKKMEQKNNIQINHFKPSSQISDYLEEYLEVIVSETIFLSKGKKVIEKIEMKRKKEGFFNFINIFDKHRLVYSIPNINTFRDLILKIVELNEVHITR